MSDAPAPFAPLHAALAEFAAGRCDAAALARACHAQRAETAQLPAAFASVLAEITNRLESAALFSEESCSFSQADLVHELEIWLQKAQQRWSAQRAA